MNRSLRRSFLAVLQPCYDIYFSELRVVLFVGVFNCFCCASVLAIVEINSLFSGY